MPTMATSTPQLTAKLKRLVESRKLNVSKLARAANVSPQAMFRYVEGESSPRSDTALLIARDQGVDPVWFIDESDTRLDPPEHDDAIAMDTARLFDLFEPTEILSLGERRYVKTAIDLYYQLYDIELLDDEVERIAMTLLMPHGEGEMPGEARVLVGDVNAIDKLIFHVVLLQVFHRPGAEIPKGIEHEGIEGPEAISPKRLIDWFKDYRKRHPGYQAIVDYLIANSHATGRWLAAQRQTFFEEYAPCHIARIIDMPGAAKHRNRKKIRAALVEKGYFTKEGKPIPFPALQPYVSDRIQRELMKDM